ncbi:nicotinate phosphoribosyltransferase [Atractiella rhizophila]|nr:nicotinate phosphoribosyltransferase [Atractiella rhizophila]
MAAATLVSILDTDLYKLTMQQAVLQHYPEALVTYQFTNRAPLMKFSVKAFQQIRYTILELGHLSLKPDERTFLEAKCPYLTPEYLDFLTSLRLTPSTQVILSHLDVQDGVGDLSVEIKGLWSEVILYEVPVMSIISQVYFQVMDTDWTRDGQLQRAKEKAVDLLKAGCVFSEFGTRRRRDYHAQDEIMKGILEGVKAFEENGGKGGRFNGTSNVHFAHKYGVNPIGTIAHEWMMGIAAKEGLEGCNGIAMTKWEETYPNGQLSIALTDTFSSKIFFGDFIQHPERARLWAGVRQDSGDPFAYIPLAVSIYKSLSIDPKSKTVVFSDSLDVERAKALKKASDEAGINCSFGIGTFFTNDFSKASNAEEKSKPLNIVIKLAKIDDQDAVKISDEVNKNTGNREAVQMVKEKLGLDKFPDTMSRPDTPVL